MSLASAKLSARLWVAAIVVALVFGASLAFAYRVGSAEIRPLRHPLAELPTELATFTGEDRELDPTVAKQVNAIESVSRVYLDQASGTEVASHLAAFSALGEPTLPHPPALCYRLSGADVVSQRPITIDAEQPFTAQLLTVDREGVKSYVVYWYSWDNIICTTRSQAILVRLKLAGRSQWPPLVKILLEARIGGSADETLRALTDFAAHVRNETADL